MTNLSNWSSSALTLNTDDVRLAGKQPGIVDVKCVVVRTGTDRYPNRWTARQSGVNGCIRDS